MKRSSPTGLARALHRFFQEYLSDQRGLSLHTLRSYRDAVLLFLRYAAQDTRRRIESLELDDFTSERVTRFLRHLETERENGITTRNARLAALHTCARVQEILNLKVRDVRFDPPHQVRLLGKGNKVRLCPIWPRTAKLLQELTASTPSTTDDPTDRYVFQNRRGEPLTRFGVRYLLRKHLPKRLA